MNDVKKPWYFSKAKIAALLFVLTGIYNAVRTEFNLPVIPEWIFAVLGGLGLYGVRSAIETNRTIITETAVKVEQATVKVDEVVQQAEAFNESRP